MVDKNEQLIDLSEKYAESNPFSRITFSNDYCFLCGRAFSDDFSEEHVVPKWLQNRHDLWNQELRLLNDTHIKYRQIKIPCCSQCNNEHLSKLESQLRAAVESGYDACLELDPALIFQWISKIWYGLQRKEVSLLKDIQSPEKGTIIDREQLESLRHLHALMQSIRQPVIYLMDKPFSVLIANLHNLGEENSYFFRDNLISQTVSLRTNEIGFIVALQDGELIRHTWGKYLERVGGRKLHPMQFDELYAHITFSCHLQYRNSNIIDRGGTELDPMPEISDIEVKEFHDYLKIILSRWLDHNLIGPPPDQIADLTLFDENENPLFFDEHGRLLDKDPPVISPGTSRPSGPESSEVD